MSDHLSDRYGMEVREFDGKEEKALFRRDLSEGGNRLLVVRGLSRSRAELEQPEHPRDHVYLDGAARGPYYDKKRGVFSLDHHEDCIRQITDATCIQAMHLTRTRVITALGNTIIGNDPDGDTVLAGWALLNADLLANDDRMFRRVQPLLLVQGNIDSYGFGFEELTGLSADVISETRQRMQWLMLEERKLKQRGQWNTIDFVDFTRNALRKIDRFTLFRTMLDVPVQMDVQEEFPLKSGRSLQFVQAPDVGVYDVEHTILTHQRDEKCACIIFHDGRAKWTVKVTGFVNEFQLQGACSALNDAELQVKQGRGVQDEKVLHCLWGGGAPIIGSPRYHDGRGPFLSKAQIVAIVVEELNRQVE